MKSRLGPIVEEVREAGAKLAEKAGYDVHNFFEILREAERNYGRPLVEKSTAPGESSDLKEGSLAPKQGNVAGALI